ASVQERAQSTVAAIEAARPAIEQRHAHMLVLQDAVSRGLQTCDDALARIDDARRQTIERMFVRQAPPVWRVGAAAVGPRPGGVLRGEGRQRPYLRAGLLAPPGALRSDHPRLCDPAAAIARAAGRSSEALGYGRPDAVHGSGAVFLGDPARPADLLAVDTEAT